MSLQEALRTFHLTGKGLETLRPAGALRPAGWPEPAPVESPYPCAAGALPLLYGAAVSATRRAAKASLAALARQMCQKMTDLLALDAVHGDPSADSVAAALGAEANELLNAGALAVAVQKAAKGAKTLPADRRLRIEQAAAVLDNFVRQQDASPAFRLFHAGSEPPGIAAEGGLGVAAADPVAAAAQFCRESLEEFGAVVRAVKTARLEGESAYQPAIHDERIARLDWRAADDEQLAGLPAVAALATSAGDLTGIAREGLPVHVLIPCPGLSGAHHGAVAMAYGTVFVLQDVLSQPDRLLPGLKQMAGLIGPAVAAVAVPEEDPGNWAALAALERSRAFPVFRYDPARGPALAERFQLDRSGVDSNASPAEAAVVGAGSAHLRLLAESDWAEVGDLPSITVAGPGGRKQRAVMTRELWVWAQERATAYRLLEEMAGIGNSHVDGAVARAKAEAEEQTRVREQAALERGREEGARTAIGRLVGALTSTKAAPVSATARSPQPVSAPVAMAAPPPAAPAKPESPAPAEDEAPAGPYIETSLCSSCNDCMKINPRLFLYNSDKQAYLGDLSMGTFADLVKAAEGCPSKCIHPGHPRPGDATATPALIARAAKLG